MLMYRLLLQDNINVYRRSPPLPEITWPTHLLPSVHDPLLQQRRQHAIKSPDSMVVPKFDLSSSSAYIEEGFGVRGGGGDVCVWGVGWILYVRA